MFCFWAVCLDRLILLKYNLKFKNKKKHCIQNNYTQNAKQNISLG